MELDDSSDRTDRTLLGFADKVRDNFGFLSDFGYSEVEALPTLVRFRKDNLEVDVYHGRRSFEIGVGFSRDGQRHELSEILTAADKEIGARFRNPTASLPGGVRAGLELVGSLTRQFGAKALLGDPETFVSLKIQRELAWTAYHLEMEANSLRPLAEEAWRRKDYAKAAELYAKFKSCLTPAEVQKLAFAEKRSGSSQK
jgi:hypothetical protein